MAIAAKSRSAGMELADRYADLSLLRTGSQYSVYEGREPGSDRLVAIKVPNEVRAAWVHEALRFQGRLLARIGDHPHIVTLYQSLTLADGRPALVLDRCAGSFADTLRGERMTPRAAIATGIKLAGALETAHRADVLHCDVRPSTVLVSEFGEPVLAAFDESVSTLPGAARFPQHVTTAHTAPELLEGADPTPATDVYGLAATLYELVAGRAAFREYAGESAATVIVRVLSGKVRPIVAPDVPFEMSDLLTWAMAADPTKRPPTPAWLAEELSRMERREGWPRTRLITG